MAIFARTLGYYKVRVVTRAVNQPALVGSDYGGLLP